MIDVVLTRLTRELATELLVTSRFVWVVKKHREQETQQPAAVKQTHAALQARTIGDAQTALTKELETEWQETNQFVSAVKKLKEQEMLQHVVVRRIRADQRAQMTAEAPTEQTVQPQIENQIRLIEPVGPSISRDTFWKTLMDSCSNTTERTQKTENTSKNSVMEHFSCMVLTKEREQMINVVLTTSTAPIQTRLNRVTVDGTIFALLANQP
jgi:hypothetical protein